jgi:UDP-2-acetamido-2-deoxy-ribo-hexuluronate aminotransferase
LRCDRRDELKVYLEDRDIPTMIYYPVPLHFQKAYMSQAFGKGAFPVTEQLSREVLSLPIHTEMHEDQLVYICDIIKKFK